MKLELFFGAGAFVYGLLHGSFGPAFIGAFFVLMVLVELVPRWVKREVRLWRSVVRHDFDQVGLERVDDRRPA